MLIFIKFKKPDSFSSKSQINSMYIYFITLVLDQYIVTKYKFGVNKLGNKCIFMCLSCN